MIARSVVDGDGLGHRVNERSRSLAKRVLRRLIGGRVYTIRRGVATGLRRQGGFDFLPRLRPTAEHRFFRAHDFRGRTVYDIGGNEGVLTLFFARAVGPTGRVLVFEPNPRSFESIQTNVGLNALGNVVAYQRGVGSRAATMELTFPDEEPGRGTFRRDAADVLRHERGPGVRTTAKIPIETIDHLVMDDCFPDPSFVKIDVEGMECEVVKGMSATIERCHPEIFLELYGISEADKSANATCALGLLRSFGYRVLHVETGTFVDDPAVFLPLEGHLYAAQA